MWPITYNLTNINNVAKQTWELIKQSNATCATLNGNLGAGKTTLVKAIGQLIGIQNNISSPTYSIINQYTGNGFSLYHLDLYRLNSVNEAIDAGVEEVLYSGNFCFIEWPDVISSILPASTLHFNINIVSQESRIINYTL
jgi:tRNA threonylcarbamoyladenosine biosynthesis protein TsaE